MLAVGLPRNREEGGVDPPRNAGEDMIARGLWPVFLTLCIPTFASISNAHPQNSYGQPLAVREQLLWNVPARNAEFIDVPHTSARSRCEQTRPPEALTTPNPLLGTTSGTGVKIKVSFIVGTDGRVHSPLILESSSTTGEHAILDTVRGWRYRPAMCNGVPTETEGKVEFSSR
jgi:Gram-negative bacterial TonB protein C-terminal